MTLSETALVLEGVFALPLAPIEETAANHETDPTEAGESELSDDHAPATRMDPAPDTRAGPEDDTAIVDNQFEEEELEAVEGEPRATTHRRLQRALGRADFDRRPVRGKRSRIAALTGS
jgi:hypothetical protein